jgi:hypothetical protein
MQILENRRCETSFNFNRSTPGSRNPSEKKNLNSQEHKEIVTIPDKGVRSSITQSLVTSDITTSGLDPMDDPDVSIFDTLDLTNPGYFTRGKTLKREPAYRK